MVRKTKEVKCQECNKVLVDKKGRIVENVYTDVEESGNDIIEKIRCKECHDIEIPLQKDIKQIFSMKPEDTISIKNHIKSLKEKYRPREVVEELDRQLREGKEEWSRRFLEAQEM